MKRGYVRHTRLVPRDVQVAALVAAGVDRDVIYIEGEVGTLADALKSLRPEAADELIVYTLDRISGTRRELEQALTAIRDKRAVIVEALTGRRSDDPGDMADMILAALKRKGLPSDEAREHARKRRSRKKPAAVSLREARAIWRDQTLSNVEAARRIGWSVVTCTRRLGKSGRPPGRPRNE